MEGKRFDALITRLGTTRLTRLRALQGLAAATAVGLTGISLAPGEAEAADVAAEHRRHRRHRRERERKICHCGDNNPQRVNCRTLKLSKEKAKRHLRRHEFDTKGKCPTTTTTPVVVTPAPAPAPPTGPGCLSQPEATRCPGEVCCGAGTKKAGTCRPNAKACG